MHQLAHRVAIAVMTIGTVEIDSEKVVIHRTYDAEQPVNADRDQQDGQRQHRRADGKVPDFLHDASIADKPTRMRDYKTVSGFEAASELRIAGL
jgi:hypothetical protein